MLAQSNPGLTGSGEINKRQGQNNTPVNTAKAVKCMVGSSYQRELQLLSEKF